MKTVSIEKAIREIKDRSFELSYYDGLVDDFIEVESVIQIIQDNIKKEKKIEKLIPHCNYRYEIVLNPEETINKINEIIDKINN